MYARRQTRPKPRKSQAKKWTAPVSGWIANRALADPRSIEGPGAAVLDNFFPRSTSVILRRGQQRYATLVDQSLPVLSMWTYRNGLTQELFCANANTIYDVTNITNAFAADITDTDGDEIGTYDDDVFGWTSTQEAAVATGYTGGEWSTAQFATSGGVFVIGVNGENDGFIYDGEMYYPYAAGGAIRLNYDAETEPFTIGDVITGATSGATGTIWRAAPSDDDPGTGFLILIDVTGTFDDDEIITDTGDGSATVNGTQSVAAPGIVFGDGSLTSADMSFVWVYRNRLFFAEKNSMNAWYNENVDQVGGTVDIFPLAGIFGSGGSLLFGSPWSLDSSGDAGLSEQCVFVSTQGEVAVFQGGNPASAEQWARVGVYKIGVPLGKDAFMRGGGDLAIATTVGLVPLSKAISLDITALNEGTISYKIADGWADALLLRGSERWVCHIYSEGKMAMVAPPDVIGSSEPVIFVSNTDTGAWARFTGWEALCMETFRGRLILGSNAGRIFIANVGGNDDGATYTGTVMPLYEDMDSPSSLKVGTVGRARARASVEAKDQINLLVDFDRTLPIAPDATTLSSLNTWDSGIWDTSRWGDNQPTVINQDWRSVGGLGYSFSPCYQVTSGAIAALDLELIDLELMFTTAEVVS